MHPPLEAQRRADGERARLLRHSAPRDARQIVRPSIAPVHREDQVADLAPERRTAVVRGLAQRAPELDAVAGYAAAALERLGKYGDNQTPSLSAAVVERAQLPRDGGRVAAPERASAQQLARHDDGQVVALAGEPLHREHKAVERLAVVDVRERGVGGNPSAEPDAVEVTVHVVHLVR